MKVLVIVESLFGNTATIADAVASGLRGAGAEVTVSTAAEPSAGECCDLLIVGSPTHNLGLPSPASRANGAARGAPAGAASEPGIREWLASRPRVDGVRVAAFDTAVRSRFAGSASKKIASAVKKQGATMVGRESFVVEGNPPELADGERERAAEWGHTLGQA